MAEHSAMTAEAREAFLAEPRLGMLLTLESGGAPIAVPVWFEWDGSRARMFTSAGSRKIARLAGDARASLLVARDRDEKEAWVAIDGTISVHEDGAFALAERLAQRYWDMTDRDHQQTVEMWRTAASQLRVLELTPTRIRSYGE